MKMDILERIMIPEQTRIPILGGIWYRFLSWLKRKMVKKLNVNSFSLNKTSRDIKIICTLTTFPERIDSVQYTIRTLFCQTMKPDRIILWLAKDEFEDQVLPDSIKELQERGLEIRYCDNLYGHKRYYKLLDEQKSDECIVMFDDDILFPKCVVERLYETWLKNKECIVCDRGQVLTFKGNDIENPGHWSCICKTGVNIPSYRILASPGGGCLVPPGVLYKDANDVNKIKEFALKTGDIWLMFMAVQNDTKIVRTYQYHRIFILSEKEQNVQLGKEAIYLGRYVETFHKLMKAYPHAYKNMISEIEECERTQ